mmetsp:Transcript_2465/g.9722  ORF Transcript_2465/g.9722 Transcript_2465/m.9722 type:complete len:262 (-) Transcript_2465:1624-2409(-)
MAGPAPHCPVRTTCGATWCTSACRSSPCGQPWTRSQTGAPTSTSRERLPQGRGHSERPFASLTALPTAGTHPWRRHSSCWAPWRRPGSWSRAGLPPARRPWPAEPGTLLTGARRPSPGRPSCRLQGCRALATRRFSSPGALPRGPRAACPLTTPAPPPRRRPGRERSSCSGTLRMLCSPATRPWKPRPASPLRPARAPRGRGPRVPQRLLPRPLLRRPGKPPARWHVWAALPASRPWSALRPSRPWLRVLGSALACSAAGA